MIKGKSKIELKNIKTGEVKIYENENMITDLFEIGDFNLLPVSINPSNLYSLFLTLIFTIYLSLIVVLNLLYSLIKI